MNVFANNLKIEFERGSARITVDVEPESKLDLLNAAEYLTQSARLSLNIERSFRHRSLDANAMFWSLCNTLATALDTTNDAVYHQLLRDYGTFVIENVYDEQSVAQLANEKGYRIVEPLGKVTVGGAQLLQYQCFPGSSQFNSQQMSRLIKGAIYECKEMGLPVESNADVDEAKKEWKGPADGSIS